MSLWLALFLFLFVDYLFYYDLLLLLWILSILTRPFSSVHHRRMRGLCGDDVNYNRYTLYLLYSYAHRTHIQIVYVIKNIFRSSDPWTLLTHISFFTTSNCAGLLDINAVTHINISMLDRPIRTLASRPMNHMKWIESLCMFAAGTEVDERQTKKL